MDVIMRQGGTELEVPGTTRAYQWRTGNMGAIATLLLNFPAIYILEWKEVTMYMASVGVKSGHNHTKKEKEKKRKKREEDMCHDEIVLCALETQTIISTVNHLTQFGGVVVITWERKRKFSL